jgi:hypothetical protein
MSLLGILKGVVGLGPGIEGCKREAAAGKAEAQFALEGFYERGQFRRTTLSPRSGIARQPSKTSMQRSSTLVFILRRAAV